MATMAVPDAERDKVAEDVACRARNREHRARNAAYQRRYRANHPERQRCRCMYNAALRAGWLHPLNTCFACHGHEGIEAHHPDYEHAYRVIPLCKRCHEEHHRRIAARECFEWPVEVIEPAWTEAGKAAHKAAMARGQATAIPPMRRMWHGHTFPHGRRAKV